jgi:hypothetical protein
MGPKLRSISEEMKNSKRAHRRSTPAIIQTARSEVEGMEGKSTRERYETPTEKVRVCDCA